MGSYVSCLTWDHMCHVSHGIICVMSHMGSYVSCLTWDHMCQLCKRQGCGTNCSTTLFQKIYWYKSIICLFLFIGFFINLGFSVAHVGIFARIWLFPLVRHDRGRGNVKKLSLKDAHTHAQWLLFLPLSWHTRSACPRSLCHVSHTLETVLSCVERRRTPLRRRRH